MGNLELGDEGVEALARGAFPALVDLHLSEHDARGRAGAALANVSWKLERVYLWGSRLGDEGVAAIAHATWRTTVRELTFGPNDIGDAGVAAIAAAEWPCLERLDFQRNTRIGEAGAKALDAAAGMPMLSELNLEETNAPKKALKSMRTRLGSGLIA